MPSQFILGSRAGQDDSGADLDDDAQICSCHVRRRIVTGYVICIDGAPPRAQNVSKGRIVQCIKDGAESVADVKTKTKAGSGCGGCTLAPRYGALERQLWLTHSRYAGVPLLTNIVQVRRGALSGMIREIRPPMLYSSGRAQESRRRREQQPVSPLCNVQGGSIQCSQVRYPFLPRYK